MLSKEEKEFRLAALKIAKEQEISMIMNTKELIEFNELDRDKIKEFSESIMKISETTKLIELVSSRQRKDTKGNDITGHKALYLTDDDYYKELIGEQAGQASMF